MSRQAGAGGASPATLEDVFCEDIDDAFDEVDELLECWRNRFSIENLALAERYAKDELMLVLGFVCNVGPRALAKQYRAVFKRRSFMGLEVHTHGREVPIAPRVFHGNGPLDHVVDAPDRDQQAVLIDNIKHVQTPEGTIPSCIWLEQVDESDCSGRCASEAGRNVVPHEFGGATYWEFGVVGGLAASMPNQVVGEKIECGTKVVNHVPDSAAPAGWDVFHYQKLVDYVSRLEVSIGSDDIRFAVLEGSNFGIKLVKVLLGPVDLYPDAEKRFICHGKISQ